jgi:hypothetical protein
MADTGEPPPGPDGAGIQPGFGPAATDSPAPESGELAIDDRPEPGQLGIVERRTWKTWQLVIAVIIAALVGMWINGNTGSAGGASTSSSGAYKLPAPSGPTATTSPASAKAQSGSTTTTTTAAGGSTTTTTAAGGSTTTTAAGGVTPAAGPATVLVPATQLTGNWTSPPFTIAGGTWNIGWAFQCTPAAPTPTFEVFVAKTGASPGSSPAVTSGVSQGQSVTPQTTLGSQRIVVHAPAGCRWVVKVTGYSG